MKCKEKKLYCSRTLPADMLNNFPENVIDEILMCLPFRDAVRTSILSTKWRYVWRILPELILSHTNWKPEEDLTDLTSNFRKIIDHILAFHFGPVTKFTLSIPYFDICPIIDDLIHFLSRNGIQHLVLRLPIRGKPYDTSQMVTLIFEDMIGGHHLKAQDMVTLRAQEYARKTRFEHKQGCVRKIAWSIEDLRTHDFGQHLMGHDLVIFIKDILVISLGPNALHGHLTL
ncbi:hypothetical protein BC332_27506 [Capsicum chinense]|nr:hypothetical protein BC332_27506 [Capsicum chinense]